MGYSIESAISKISEISASITELNLGVDNAKSELKSAWGSAKSEQIANSLDDINTGLSTVKADVEEFSAHLTNYANSIGAADSSSNISSASVGNGASAGNGGFGVRGVSTNYKM